MSKHPNTLTDEIKRIAMVGAINAGAKIQPSTAREVGLILCIDCGAIMPESTAPLKEICKECRWTYQDEGRSYRTGSR